MRGSVEIASLDVEHLTCIRGESVLFRDLSFASAAGQALAIEGPNGIGKTSLLRMIAGFLRPAAGMIVIKASSEIAEPEERGKHIGWLGHQEGAKPQLTPAEVLTFFAHLYGGETDVTAALT